MARRSKHSVSRKRKHTRRHKTHRHRRMHRKGGDALSGAPVGYHLSGDWSSKMSLGQGGDYLKYHAGQHGGALDGAPLSAITGSGLPQNMMGAAMQSGVLKAYADVAGLKDQSGGRRRRKCCTKRHRHSKKRCGKKYRKSCRKSRGGSRKSRRQRKSRGGDLSYAPFPNKGMLLDSSMDYARAGLNPEWKTDVAYDMAKIRDTQ